LHEVLLFSYLRSYHQYERLVRTDIGLAYDHPLAFTHRDFGLDPGMAISREGNVQGEIVQPD
jgi:hypothetical protein